MRGRSRFCLPNQLAQKRSHESCISGGQPAEVFREALERAYADGAGKLQSVGEANDANEADEADEADEAGVCGDDGCAVPGK
ncbi:hypothetical protein [Streptomyces nigrescens]